jgi:hypothetical protein
LQKHMANILKLLADSVDGEGDDSMVSFWLFPLLYMSMFLLSRYSCLCDKVD